MKAVNFFKIDGGDINDEDVSFDFSKQVNAKESYNENLQVQKMKEDKKLNFITENKLTNESGFNLDLSADGLKDDEFEKF